jgi:hypothetical protein
MVSSNEVGAMTLPAITMTRYDDITLIKVAREIAINHYPLETILERYKIEQDQWEELRLNPRFSELLEREIAEWSGALNTFERTKLKAAAMIEEYLPEGNARIHDSKENLPAKVELLKWLAKIAGMGERDFTTANGSGERFSVTINLGADSKLEFEKPLPARVIEHEPEQ